MRRATIQPIVRFIAWAVFIAILMAGKTASAETPTPLISLIASLDHAGKDSIGSMPGNRQTHLAFLQMLETIVAGNEDAISVESAGYELKRVTQDGRRYTVLIDAAESVGPTVVLAAAPQRDLIFEAPHGMADRATDIQSAIALTRLGARALILAGAHRCAAMSESSCSGQTRICGDGRNPYRTSDGAHNPDTRFHMAHLVLTDAWPESTAVQLHGFGVKGTDAWVVLSDGSRESRPGDTALSGAVRDGIRVWFGRPERAVSCQDPNDERYDYRTLCARTNVQGRHLNDSADSCNVTGETASGRFLHVEQAWEIRREVRAHWRNIDSAPLATVVIDALGVALPCTLAACR